MSHIHALYVNLHHFYGLNRVFFSKWKIGDFEKIITNFQLKNSKSKKKNASFPLKSVRNFRVAWMRHKFYDYHDFQPKIRCA
jgi:hypothetical protein